MPKENPSSVLGSSDTGIRGSNQAGMRAHNERLVLSLIRRHGATAKADIARATGLSAQTVSVIMRALEADELLTRGEPVRGRVGQPSIPMSLSQDGAFFFGLKVGRRSLELVLTDFLGVVRARVRQTHDYPMPEATVRFTRNALTRMLGAMTPRDRDRVGGLGIAMPFSLWDWADNLSAPPEEMAAWRTADLGRSIARVIDIPVFVQNDATAACGAELVFGRDETPLDFLHFYIGYFIGGGVVLNGSLYSGPSGNAGAIGSIPVASTPDGRERQLIDVASLGTLEEHLHKAGTDTSDLWQAPEELERNPDVLAAWIDDAAAGIAHAIVSAVSVIDFGTVMIDGWITADMRRRLVEATAAQLEQRNFAGLARPDLREGTIGADARALGAASLPLSERFLVEKLAFQGA
ncbi:ROK family transcriptional regulator [Psychromarinibacter halotolerans]|uniref:ROK family protein n=1 Tax=Psychromarinibacter halotolerans TaxID=1775175 RepID=A0ABV7H2C8_9RHOB|nr:ROK family transcriptional regulator [Psychromarinibacter halotolerans]MDF0596564.1 ROK family transcriptional regulator [Psychromarinibacter halotolerans]